MLITLRPQHTFSCVIAAVVLLVVAIVTLCLQLTAAVLGSRVTWPGNAPGPPPVLAKLGALPGTRPVQVYLGHL